MTLRIEIAKSKHKKNTFNAREGDIEGSTHVHNMSKKDVLEFISDWIDEL